MTNVMYVVASQRQGTPAGNLLAKMFYGGFLGSVLRRGDYSGFPHNGGEHSLRLGMAPEDIEAFLELVQERYSSHEGSQPFVNSVRERMSHARRLAA